VSQKHPACILVVLPDHPFPLEMGSRVRNLRILEALARSFRLVIVTLVHDPGQLADPGPVAKLGRWVPVPAPHHRSRAHQVYWHLRARGAAWFGGIHHETFFLSFPALSARVRRLLDEERPDLVHAAYWYTLRHLQNLPRPPLWVVDTHDVQFERQDRLLGGGTEREREAELRELSRYDRIVAITERDQATFRRHLPAGSPAVEVIGMGLDLDEWTPDAVRPALPDAPRVAFLGNLATEANRDGALHLLRDLVPVLRRGRSDLEVLVLGPAAGAEIQSAAAAVGATVQGFAPDIRPYLRSTRVLALSLHAGSGQRGRVVESLALGVPVVGYRSALEGLEFREGEGIVTVDTADEFCRAVTRILDDPAAAETLGAAGRARVAHCYGLESTYLRFPALYRRMLEEKTKAS
jgi:glycosyltransferase involved in cell wall biosynthesis